MKKLAVLLSLILCVSLAGCKAKDTPVSSQQEATSSTVSQPEKDGNTEVKPVTPSIEILDGPLGDAPVFGEESEFSESFVFSADLPVKNFSFFRVDMTYDEQTNTLIGSPVKEYGFLENLPAEENVLLIGETGEILPTLAISFDSLDGEVYYYAIEISGEDGHAFLTPFTIK